MVRFKKLQIISCWAWLYHDTWLLKLFVVHIFSAFILEFRLPEKKELLVAVIPEQKVNYKKILFQEYCPLMEWYVTLYLIWKRGK